MIPQALPKSDRIEVPRSSGALIGAALLSALLTFELLRSFSMSHSLAQLIVLPLVLLGIAMLARRVLPIPHILSGAVLVFAAVGVGISQVVRSGDSDTVVLAKLDGDELEAVTQSFWRNLNEYLRVHNGPRLMREPEAFSTGDNIGSDLRSHSRSALLWGNSRWINLSMQSAQAVTLRDIARPERSGEFAELFGNFEIVQDIPEVGLSLKPEGETVQYLTFLLMGKLLESDPRYLPLSDAERELYLWQANGVVGRWVNQAHRAYPMLLIGNQALRRGLAGGAPQISELACAERAYERGLDLIDDPKQNIELYVGLKNNLAVLRYINSWWLGKGTLAEVAEDFRVLSFMRKSASRSWYPQRAWRSAYHNLMVLVQSGEYDLPVRGEEPGPHSKLVKKGVRKR